jgi:threonyl-tRNA synthetase
MLHRAALGALERFIGIMIENYAGKLPHWLAPVQCVVAPITDEAGDYAQTVLKTLKDKGLRADIDARNEKINYKIREHSVAKVPYIFVVGKREAEDSTVAIRQLGTQDQKILSLDEASALLEKSCKAPF